MQTTRNQVVTTTRSTTTTRQESARAGADRRANTPVPLTEVDGLRLVIGRAVGRRRNGLASWRRALCLLLLCLCPPGIGQTLPATASTGEAQHAAEPAATERGGAAAANSVATAARGVLFERWYALTIHNQHAGFMRIRQERRAAEEKIVDLGGGPGTDEQHSVSADETALSASASGASDDHISTRSETRLTMSRGATVIGIELATEFIETVDGTPVEMWSYQKMSEQAVETTFRFEDGRIAIYRGPRPVGRAAADAPDREPDELVDAPDAVWLTPGEAGRHIQARLAAGSRTMFYRTLDPGYGVEPVTVRRRLVDSDATVEHDGRSVPATEWRVWQSTMPAVPSVEVLDAEGNLLEGRSNLGGLVELTMRVADASIVNRGGRPPELLISTFVRPDRRISDPRRVTRAVYELRVEDGRLDDLPSGVAGQNAERLDRRRFRVTVDARRAHAADAADAGNEAYLRSSSFIDHQHPRIRELAGEAVSALPKQATAAQRAEALRLAVYRHISNKNLAKGFAAASEAAIDRAGDCTEHAVLLAALLRAEGIPGRLVAGLVYVDAFEGERDVFGYHMWTQALIDGRWVDFDATTQRRFDATHIALIDAALEDDNVAARMTPMLPLLGRLQINVVEAERNGTVAPDVLPWPVRSTP